MKIRLLIVALVLAAGCAKSESIESKAASKPERVDFVTGYSVEGKGPVESPVSKPGPVQPD